MRYFLYLTTALVATSVTSTTIPRRIDQYLDVCGTEISPEAVREAETRFAANRVSPNAGARPSSFDVYWHVVSKNSSAAGGNIPEALITRQMEVINQDYQQVGLSWRLVRTTRTVNAEWAENLTSNSPQEAAMQRTLRQGGAADLNVYSVVSIGGGPPGSIVNGYATFPWWYKDNQSGDGVVLAQHALPGGPLPTRDLGRTLSHEIGHWVGLYHTFQGGCDAPGDHVDDTPAEASPARGCPTGRDSCPAAGQDPIHNIMDYTADSCRTNLTRGQITRLFDQLRTYRGV